MYILFIIIYNFIWYIFCLKICLLQVTALVLNVPDPIHGHRVIRSINGTGSRFVKDFLFFWSSVIMDCMLSTFDSRVLLMRWRRQWSDIFHLHQWTASIKPRLLLSVACYVSWGIFLFSVEFSLCLVSMRLSILTEFTIYNSRRKI